MMQYKYTHSPLIYFLLYPLMFTMDYAYKGVIASVGLLLIYPLLSIISDLLYKKISSINIVYIVSFLGVLFATIYTLFLASIDWKLYREIGFIFPAAMSSSVFFIGHTYDNDHKATTEKYPFIEALIVSVFIILFSCLQDFFIHSTVDFRFGDFGTIYTFGVDTSFKDAQTPVSVRGIVLLPIQIRILMFFIVGSIISLMGFRKKTY